MLSLYSGSLLTRTASRFSNWYAHLLHRIYVYKYIYIFSILS